MSAAATSLPQWETPDYYAGFDPVGDYVLLGINRDSGALDRSNWECVIAAIGVETGAPVPQLGDEDPRPAAYWWDASHWLCGWVRYLMVSQDAPAHVLELAQRIRDDLDGYPVFDEDHLSDLEYSEAEEYWRDCSVADRMDAIKRSGTDASIFAARRAYIPRDENGGLYDYLRSN